MNLSEQDLKDIKKILGREASTVELNIFDTMWSEHCSYKSTKEVLKKYLPTKGSEVALGIGEDSGIIRFTKHEGKQYCIAVSHESHNHPSQVLPIEGAATGVGGVVRDVYCMGADVIGVLNSLHFGINKGDQPHIDEIAEKVVLGVSDYANPLGVPVLGGETLYHPSYNDNCLVNVAALGLLIEDDIIHSYVPEEANDTPYDVILIGKSTDATGFGGASFSSATLDASNQASNIGAVQVHDPFLKRVLVEAIKFLLQEIKDKKVPVGFKDLGAGGISCATSEIAVAGGFGVTVDLDKVNVAIDGLPGEIIACSETQERFCIVVPKSFSSKVLEIFNEKFALPKLYKNAGAAIIGEVTKNTDFKLFYKGECVCDMPVAAITTEVRAERKAKKIDVKTNILSSPTLNKSIKDAALGLFDSNNNISKRHIYRYFDNAVKGNAIVYPGETDAVIIAPIEGCNTGLIASMDSNLYGLSNPYVSGAYAVAEGVRNIIAGGGKPIAVTDCLNYGNPEDEEVFYCFEEGVRGIADACIGLNMNPNDNAIPVISGNVSLYNQSKKGSQVIPSPVIVVIGKIEDYQNLVTMQLRNSNQDLFLIGERHAEFGGTQIEPYLSEESKAPEVRFNEEKKQNLAVQSLIESNLLTASHDISSGGLWMSLCEMVFGERGACKVGLDVKVENPITTLFSENGGYVVACESRQKEQVEEILKLKKVNYSYLGKTTERKAINIDLEGKERIEFPLNELSKIWNRKND